MEDNKPLCIRCLEDFPVAQEPARWEMGEMRPVSKLPKRLRDKVQPDQMDTRGKSYLCGNCYFDLLDEEDDE